jgi:hypothetical protein
MRWGAVMALIDIREGMIQRDRGKDVERYH